MVLNEGTHASTKPFDSPYFGLEWFIVIPSFSAHSVNVLQKDPALSYLMMSGLQKVFIIFSRIYMTVFVDRLSVWWANMYPVARSARMR